MDKYGEHKKTKIAEHHRHSPIDVAEDLLEHGRLVQYDDLVVVVAVRAGVDDAVHVEVEVVDLPIDVKALVDALVDVGILIGQPPEHLGDAVEGRRGGRRSVRASCWRIGIGSIGICIRTPQRRHYVTVRPGY